MRWKSEGLALAFGALIVFEICGDEFFFPGVGNLDSIFGPHNGSSAWMDLFFPVCSILVLALYGRSKGPFSLSGRSVGSWLFFLVGLGLLQFDDLFVLLGHRIYPPVAYWFFVRVVFLLGALTAFFVFGRECQKAGGRGKGS
jgi:hypothetical protein